MSKSVLHTISTRNSFINPRAAGPRGDIGRGLKPHMIQILTCHVPDEIYINYNTSNVFCVGMKYTACGIG